MAAEYKVEWKSKPTGQTSIELRSKGQIGQ